MSIFSIFNLQPRAVTIPTPPASSPAPANPPAPVPSPAPAAPVQALPALRRSFSLQVMPGYVWQSFGNNVDDPHGGFGIRGRVSAFPYYFNPRMGLEYAALCANHQSVSRDLGEGVTSSAQVSGAGWCPELGIQASSWLRVSGGLYLGAQHTSSTAPFDGRGGLVYANNPVGLSVNQAAFRMGGSLSIMASPRVGPINLLIGARYEVGRTFQSFVPDTLHRDPSWPAVPADSTDHFLGFALGFTLDRSQAVARNAEEAPAARSSSSPAPAPAPAQSPSPAPTPAPTAPASTATRTHIDPVTFTTTANRVANPRALRNAIQTLANEIHLGDGLNQANSSGISITITYDHNNRGQIRLNHVGMTDGTSYSQRSNNFPASIPEGLLTKIEALIREMSTHTPNGIPTYTGNQREAIHMTIHRNADGTVAVN